MSHTSAILAASLSWDDAATAALLPSKRRVIVQNESMAWQNLSQLGADAEGYTMPSPWRRTYRQNGKTIEVPRRGKRIPPPNRLLEIHGLAGAIGEQLGLAWTAEQDVQRFVATRGERGPGHQRLIQRALAELAGHFVLGAAHSLANLTLRLLLLNTQASVQLCKAYKVPEFPPGADDRTVWPTLNDRMIKAMTRAATSSANRFMVAAATAVNDLHGGTAFAALSQRRGLDYHRRRPQSIEHVSPRKDVMTHGPAVSTFTMPAPALEPEADPDAVHQVVIDALEPLRSTMHTIRLLLPKAIRAEGITYVFG